MNSLREQREKRRARKEREQNAMKKRMNNVQQAHFEKLREQRKEEEKKIFGEAIERVDDAGKTGKDTMGKLQQQRAQLQRVDDDLLEIDDTLSRTGS